MDQLSLGVMGRSRKENERRLAIHPLHIGRIAADWDGAHVSADERISYAPVVEALHAETKRRRQSTPRNGLTILRPSSSVIPFRASSDHGTSNSARNAAAMKAQRIRPMRIFLIMILLFPDGEETGPRGGFLNQPRGPALMPNPLKIWTGPAVDYLRPNKPA